MNKSRPVGGYVYLRDRDAGALRSASPVVIVTVRAHLDSAMVTRLFEENPITSAP